MFIQFLGTSSGTPTKQRNVSGLALQESKGRSWYLVDCGEATQHQLLHTKLSLNTLKGIFITHVHGDHCYGLPGLLGSAGMTGRTETLTIVAPAGIREWIEATQRFTEFHLSFELNFVLPEALMLNQDNDFPEMTFGQFNVAATPLIHRVESYAYSFTENWVDGELDVAGLRASDLPAGSDWGRLKSGIDVSHDGKLYRARDFVITDSVPRKVVVCGDNAEPAVLKDLCNSCDVLIHEATYAKELAEQAATYGHSYAEQVAAFAAQQAIPNLLLTHFSPRYQLNPQVKSSVDLLRQEARTVYRGALFLAEDLHRYRLDKEGGLHAEQ
ncbi:MBL fold metallo-hydrolase [Aliamphritea spongicola]|uniref:MBL fold metallo-hydrolase n=1 Tax=Aliamphritea spongicola TaxID=707589 RepID=UPI00196B42B9|nr:ribonuclease Z [Aliamphritea spongicola]